MSVQLSVVVPTGRNPSNLAQVLQAIEASDLPRDLWELIVVDDGGTDETVAIAAPHADTIVRLTGKPHGAPYARNRGAEVAQGEILVFVDDDVCVQPNTLRRFALAFLDSPDVAAVHGSFDDAPSRGLVSQYRDLIDHYLHNGSRGEASGFWADCGAVRRAPFFAVGMFNEWHFSREQIEALELGHRLLDQGFRIAFRPEIAASHLKRWTLGRMIATDLRERSVPRSRLLMKRGDAAIGPAVPEKACAVLTWVGLLLGILWLISDRSLFAVLAATAFGAVFLLNLPVFNVFRRRRGLAFTVAVAPLHLLHFVLTGIALVLGVVLHHSVGDPQPSATVQAFSEVGVVKWPPVPRPVDSASKPPANGSQSGT
ncbi:MAG: glycosyltransferase family 2 protein [Gemmatimonadales bacterium]